MSDAPEVSEQSNTAPMPAGPVPAPATARAYRGWWIRLLASVGALVFAYAAWTSWFIAIDDSGHAMNAPLFIDPSYAIQFGYVKLGGVVPSPFVVAAFTMLGLLLAPLLWRPASSLLGAIAAHLFGLWVAFATLLVVVFGLTPTVSGNGVIFTRTLGDSQDVAVHITGQFALGFWLAAAALVPLWIAVIGLLVSEWRRHAFWHLPGNDEDTPRSLVQLPGAAALNLGLIIWAIGFFSMGWAAFQCTQTPLFFGSCQGESAAAGVFGGLDQATRSVAISSAYDPRILLLLDPGIAANAVGVLLGGGALLIFLGVWLRTVTRAFCVWTALWLVVAVAFVGLAYSGIAFLIAHTSGEWTMQAGVFVSLLGLFIALVGLATLSFAALRRRAAE